MEQNLPDLLHILLIVCPLVFMAGFIDSVAGGGGLISVPAYLIAGLPTHLAMGTNKFVMSFGTGVACFKYLKSGKVMLKVALISAFGCIIGSAIGTKLALLLDADKLRWLLLVALPLVAVFLSFNRQLGHDDAAPKALSPARFTITALGIGITIGCYDGLIGPGTGTFLILGFSSLLGLDLLTSSGCAKVSNLASNLTSMVLYLSAGKVWLALAGPAIVFCIAGNYAGAQYAIRGGSTKVRSVIYVVLALLFIRTIYDLWL